MSIRIASVLLAAGVLWSLPATGADPERGRTLHDKHCVMCHNTSAYKKEGKIKTYDQLRAEVLRWQAAASLRWSKDDVEDVSTPLAQAYYDIPCPTC